MNKITRTKATFTLALITLFGSSISCISTKNRTNNKRDVASNVVLELSSNKLEGNSIEVAPAIIKEWLGDSVAELAGENIAWSFKRSGADEVVIDIELQDQNQDQDNLIYKPLTMYIHKTIRDHKFGDQYINLIHKSADLWEKNLGRELFEIKNYRGFRSSDLTTYDGTSMISYGYFEDGPYKGLFGKAFRRKSIDIKSLVFNFKINRRVVETDILMNGHTLENKEECQELIKPYNFSFTSNYSNQDKCSLSLFYATMTHELGHSLYLAHIKNPMSAMVNPIAIYDMLLRLRDYFEKDKLHKMDIDAFNELYNVEED